MHVSIYAFLELNWNSTAESDVNSTFQIQTFEMAQKNANDF